MNRKTFRLVIILATLSIAGVIVTQLFWVQRAFDLRTTQFTHNVNIALLNTASAICEINGNEIAPDPIEQLSSNYFVVNLNDRIAPDILESVLKSEFGKREIANDFEYGIFDCANEEMVYGNYVNLNSEEPDLAGKSRFPELNKDAYYFGVYFPNKPADIAGQMGIWTFSSIVLLIVVIFFTYTLFVILRQKRLSEVQRDFINNMTHEFKTPISTISVSSEVLKDPGIIQQPQRLQNYANIIQKESNRLRNQVDRVLQMATMDIEKLELKKEEVDIEEVIQSVCESIRPSLNAKNGKLLYDNHAGSMLIKADKLHLTNILYNLLDNAVKYTHRDVVINIETIKISEGIQILISDNGEGINKDHLKYIFNKFYRVPKGDVHDVKGFGLGLHYVKLVVQAHGGKISVSSTPGKGSTFKLILPYDGK